MSTFNLKLEYPDQNFSWYETNEDNITPRCPTGWVVESTTEFARYYKDGARYTTDILVDENISIPFESLDVSDISTRVFEFTHLFDAGPVAYSIDIYFNDTDFTTLNFASANVEYIETVQIPNNTEYIKIVAPTTNGLTHIYSDIEFRIFTGEFDITTELSNMSVNSNNKISISVNDTVNVTSLKNRDVLYKNEFILTSTEEKEFNSLLNLALLNKLLVSVNINYTDEAGDSLASIPSGGLENVIKYYFINNTRTQKTGLYSYMNMTYQQFSNNRTRL